MHRIDTSTAQKDKFGQGKTGFTNGDPTTGTPSTKLNSDICDALQEEVCTVIERSGIRLNKSQHDQLTQAIRKLSEEEATRAKIALVDSAPLDLNTLKKLSQALGNNPKFSETVTNLLNQKLAKNQNGADIPDKNLFLKNLGLLETVDCAKNALDKRTGGTINGNLHVTQSVHIGDDDSGLRANGDGNVAFYANNAKVASWNNDRLHWLKNVEIDGTINTHSNLHISWGGRTAVYQENGDIHGPFWGGHLSGWVENRIRGSAEFWVNGDNWWFKDNRRGLIFQGGYRDGTSGDRVIERVGLNIHVPNRLLYVGTTIANFSQGFDTTWNHQVASLSGEKDGFTWIHGWAEQKMYWMAVGY